MRTFNFGTVFVRQAPVGIEAEFAETKYITICMASMLQAMISGVPVLLFVRDMPQAYYLVFVLL